MEPDYTPFILDPCLSVCPNSPNFAITYFDLMIFFRITLLYVDVRLICNNK